MVRREIVQRDVLYAWATGARTSSANRPRRRDDDWRDDARRDAAPRPRDG